MNKFARRSFVFFMGAFLLGYLFFFLLQLQQYPEESLLYFYKVPWIFEEALRMLIEYFPVLAISAVLLAFATIPGTHAELIGGTGVISSSVSRTIILFLIFTLLYSILSVGLLPVLYEHRHNRLYQSRLARSYLQQAEAAEQQDELEAAYLLYRDYLEIDEDNRAIKDKVNYLEGQVSLQEAAERQQVREEEPRRSLRHDNYRDMSANELVTQARQALEQDDPFTAHYMALLAQRVAERENKTREDAKRLAAKAWEQIASLEPSREEQTAHRLYSRKLSGYQAFTREQPIKAYYIFTSLIEENPGDPDVKEYYQRSRQQAEQVSYFIDEAEMLKSNPGTRKIVYLDDERELLFFEKLVIESGRIWAYGIELLKFSPAGMQEHISAPYGKFSGDTIILQGIDRQKEGRSIQPTVHSSSEEEYLRTSIRITPSIPQLLRLSREQAFLNRLTLPDLLVLQPVISEYGYPSYQFGVLTLMRILEPFLFLIFAIFAVAFGWHTRVHARGFPWMILVLAPLLPFVIDQLVILYEYLHRLLLTAVVLEYGFVTGMVGLLLLEGVLLFMALFSVAIQKEL
ncbi:MAG: LptF/LptG family permease [Spirochaetia bacterium]|nr:LptF/LptG family permease [Spirochaetia bacterium]